MKKDSGKEKRTISIIIPCLNEEGNVRATVCSIKEALSSACAFADYEILIINDGSTDSTGAVIDSIAAGDRRVKAVHNGRNMGFGYSYTEGVRRASMDYIVMVPGDNEIPTEALERIFSRVGRADVMIPYTANTEVRKPARRALSRLFVLGMNILFGLDLRYYNGTCVIRSALLKKIPVKTWGFAYMATILVRLIRSGAVFTEIGVDIRQRQTGTSKALRPASVLNVLKAVAVLFWEVRVRDRANYRAEPRRVEAR